MGKLITALSEYTFNRRTNANTSSRTRLNHPEQLPPDQLPRVEDTEQNPNLLSTSTTLISSVLELSTKISQEVELVTTEIESIPIEITTIELPNECSNFYLACRNNNIEEVEKLLKTLTLDEIDRIEPNGSTALHAASYHGHRDIVKLLLEAGADRAIENKFQCLPFDEAADNETKELFLRIPITDRFVWNTETATEERHIIQSLYNNTNRFTSVVRMFEKIQKNYIEKGSANFDGIDNIKRFFRKATEEQDPTWIIKAYTAETDFYKILNREIAGGVTQFHKERRYLITLLWHHPKLDQLAYIGLSYRVMQINFDDLQKYEKGCMLMSKSFLSSSIDRKVAELFLCRKEAAQEQNKTPVRLKRNGTFIKLWIMCIYHIKHQRSALHIENASQYANEGEILIMSYTIFQVKKIDQIKSSYLPKEQSITQIQLEECQTYF